MSRYFIVLCFVSFVFCKVQGQNNFEITKAEATAQLDLSDLSLSETDSIELILDSLYTHRSASVFVILCIPPSTANLTDSIHIKLGRSQGASDIANISLKENGMNLPPGTTIEQTADWYKIYLGDFMDTSSLFLEAWLSDAQGNISAILTYSYEL